MALGASGWTKFYDAMKLLGVDDYDGERFGFYGQTQKADQHLQDLWVRKIKSLKSRR